MSEISIDTLKTMLANLDDAKKYQSLRDVMETLPAPDLAAVFEDLPAEKLPVLFRLCPKDLAADVFTELTPETQQKLIDGLTDTELKAVVDELFVDDATDLVEEMPANVVKRILGQADPTTRRMINELLKYPEDSAGGVMTTELMELRPDMTVAQAMEAIRRNGFDKETINNCYVTDDSRRLIGVVSLRALVLAKNTEEPIKDLMDSNVVSVSTTTDQEDVSNLFEKYGFLAIPVVDAENRLVGIVTIDDAISILQDEASEDIAKMNAIGPSDKPYFKQSMWDLYKSRAPWLLFLMISATGAAMRSNTSSFTKLHTASVPPHSKATRLSRQRMRGRSWGWISPTAMPRMMVEVLWLPALPPASVSMGMYAVSTVTAASASSYPRMTMLEKVALIIRNSSHGARLLYRSHMLCLK